MLLTIKRIPAYGSFDFEVDGVMKRMPIFAEESFTVVNVGMFEFIHAKFDHLYVTEDFAGAFEGLELPYALPVFKFSFTRPPSPDPAFAGRASDVQFYVSLEEGERFLRLFDASQTAEGDTTNEVENDWSN